MNSFREQVFYWLDAGESNRKATTAIKAIGLLIAFSIFLAVAATEPGVRSSQGELLVNLDIIVAAIFSVEYVARLWVSPLKDGARKGLPDTWDCAITPLAILDLIAIAQRFLGLSALSFICSGLFD